MPDQAAVKLRPAVVEAEPPPARPRSWRKLLGQAVGIAVTLVVVWLVVQHARTLDWHAIWQSLIDTPRSTLAWAVVLSAAAQIAYACYDLLGRRYLLHGLSRKAVFAVGLVTYAFTLNFGSLVGGVALRWRLYSRMGLDAGDVGRLFVFSLFTNWSGYTLLAGGLMVARSFPLPPSMAHAIGLGWQQAIGGLLLLAVLAYLLLCSGSKQRVLAFRGRRFDLPNARMASLQIALSTVHWALTGLLLWVLIPGGLSYPTVLATLLSAAVVGAMVHVPGGLGVIEAVFVATLGHQVSEHALLAALLAYRATFYLMPLAVAVVIHGVLESQARRLMAESALMTEP